MIGALRPLACTGCCDHQRLTLIVALATLVLTVLLYLVIPKGLFPTQDTGQLQARIEAAQDVSYARMARAAAGGGATRSWPTRRCESLSSFVGVDAANNTMLHTGRMLINLQAPTTATRQSVMAAAARARAQQVAGITLYLQPTQDLTIDAETGPTAVPRLARRRRHRDRERLGEQAGRARCATCRRCATSTTDAGAQGLAAYVDIDRDTAVAPVDHRQRDRRRALQRLRPAHRLDDLHRDQPVPRDPRGAARGAGTRRSRWASCNLRTSAGTPTPLSARRDDHASSRRRCRSRTSRSTRPRTHRLRHRARRLARAAAVDAIRAAAKEIGMPAGVTHDLPRRGRAPTRSR